MAGKRFTVEAVFRGINKISKPVKSMGRSISNFVRQSNKKISKLGQRFKSLGLAMGKAIIGGAGIAAAAMGAAVMKTAELGDEAAKTGRRLGITAESLQELRFAADRQGVSSSLLNSSFTALQKRVGELKSGTGSLYAFLKKTGDSALFRQLKLAKNTEEAFALITQKAETIKDPMKKAAFAAAAFSRSGVDMLKFMEAGTGGISKLREEARKYGAVISNEAANNSELFIDAMTNFKAVTAGVALTLGAKLMPALTEIIQGFADFWAENKQIISVGIDKFLVNLKLVIKALIPVLKLMADFGENAFDFIVFASPFLKPFIATLLIYKGVLIAIAFVTKLWTIAQGILNAVLTANPIGFIIVAIAALIAGIVVLVQNWDLVTDALKRAWVWFQKMLDNPLIATAALVFAPFITIPALIMKNWDPLKAFFNSIWDTLTAGFQRAMDQVNSIIQKIETIPGVKAGFEFLTGDDESAATTRAVTPGERISRSIETRETSSTLTIKDESGRAELSTQKGGGPKIALSASGGL